MASSPNSNNDVKQPSKRDTKDPQPSESSSSVVRKLEIVNPATEELLTIVDQDTPQQVEQKFKRARAAQAKWAQVPLKQRKEVMHKFCELLLTQLDSLAKQLTLETGIPFGFCKMVHSFVPDRIKYFIQQAESSLAPEDQHSDIPGVKIQVAYEPRGVLAHISAWNYPVLMGCDIIVPALLCGNGVLYKPSEFASLTCQQMCKIFYQAGVPEDLLACCIGDGVVGAEILKHPIDGLCFIGSHATGMKIKHATASLLIPIELEMGGKDAFLVLSDADIEKTASSLVDGAYDHTGQSCNSVERIYVMEQVYKQFNEVFVEKVKSLPQGDIMDEKTRIGPLTRKMQLAVLEDQVQDAVAKGAKVILGGKRVPNRKGYFFEPTVVIDCNHSMKLMQEESFGPIVGIQKIPANATEDQIIQLLNDNRYGLTSGVFTKSKETALRFMRRLNTGSVYWNACGITEACAPWSGRKDSGLGYILSGNFRHQYLIPKTMYFLE